MTPLSSLTKMDKLLNKRLEELKRERKRGRRVVGYFCSYVPEEIIWAAGMIPLRLCRCGDNQAASVGATYLTANACPFACSCVGLKKEKRDSYFNLADLMADAPACLQMRRVLEVWERYLGATVIPLAFPRQFYSPEGQTYFAHSIEQFARELAEHQGNRITDAGLTRAVELFNAIRRQQRWLYAGLKQDSFPLSWSQVLRVIRAGFLLDREQYLQALHGLVDEVKSQPAAAPSHNNIRLLIAGGMLAPGDDKLMNILAEAGGKIVMDELCTGSRSIYGEIARPSFDSIARRYLNNIPCGSLPYPRLDDDPRHRHLKRLAAEYRINGVIYYTLRFCDAYSFKVGHLRQLTSSMGIPFLHISSDYSSADVGQMRTRVEAFLESIQDNYRIEGNSV
jgi:benzoyl-CoA reductase/2-hydroxyglutaryl-CoA dehydratase subunit BcrC/BadD/HgdB